jgi:hypothetical protein
MRMPELEEGEGIELNEAVVFIHSPLGVFGGHMGRLVLTNKRLMFMGMQLYGMTSPLQGVVPRYSFPLDEIAHVERASWTIRFRGSLLGAGGFSVSLDQEPDPYDFQTRNVERWVEMIERALALVQNRGNVDG